MKKLLFSALLALLASAGTAQAQRKPHADPAADTARTRTIEGVVIDAQSKQPLPGVTVLIKNTTTGFSTAANGRYSLVVPHASSATLVFSSVGYVMQERKVGSASVINVALTQDVKQLNEVVVTGYDGFTGWSADKSASTSKRKMKANQAAANASYAATVLTGRVPGVAITPARAEAGAGDSYAQIKENTFFDVKKAPLSTFALDVDNASYSNVRRFLNEGQLPPRDAVRVEEMLNYFRYKYNPRVCSFFKRQA